MKRPNRTSKRKEEDDDHIPGSRDVAVSKFRSFVLYGPSGTGKTTIAATFPKPMLLLDCRDEGTDSISDIEDCRVLDIEDTEDMEDAYWWIKKHPKRYKTVVIDTVSMLQQLATKELIGEKGKGGKAIGDWGAMSQQEYGRVTSYMKEWLINFRDLTRDGINVVFIAQDRVFNTDDEDDSHNRIAPEVGPALSPSVAKVLNAAVSMIGSTFIKETKKTKEVKGKKKTESVMRYCLLMGPNPVYRTKVRKPRSTEVPDYIVDATYEDILDIIKGEA